MSHSLRRQDKKIKKGESSSAESSSYGNADLAIARDIVTSATVGGNLSSPEGLIGMRIVVDPPNANTDIILIHGLTGNREDTWMNHQKNFWPRELAQDLPDARIMTYGYDAHVVRRWGMAGNNTLRTDGRDLAIAVSSHRADCSTRPVIFIAHSLGGFVCEEALLSCRDAGEDPEALEELFQSTRGIIFMGTPHQGAALATWAERLAKAINLLWRTNPEILGVLKRKSELLAIVQDRFQKLLKCHDVDIKIFCFFETKPVPGVGIIVEEQSAVLRQYSSQSIAADHVNMPKFSGREDAGYKNLVFKLKEWMKLTESPKKKVKLTQDAKADEILVAPASQTFGNVSGNRNNSGAVGNFANVQGGFHFYSDSDDRHLDHERRIRCHLKLRTSEYERFKNDRNPKRVEGTCQWVLKDERYIDWKSEQDCRLIWISANPGCGKSVLSRFMADEELRKTPQLAVCYFFFKDDNEDQRTAANALCAILHQLFSEKPELLKHAIEVSERNRGIEKNFQLLWNVLMRAAADPQAGQIVCIFDALDECRESEQSKMLEALGSLFLDVPSATSTMALKFLITSRSTQRIERVFNKLTRETSAVIHLPGENKTDEILHEIDLVIEAEIKKIEYEIQPSGRTIESLRREITKVEHRTYIWLKLIFELINGDLESVRKKGRQKLFGRIPDSVNAAYTAILEKSEDEKQARRLLSIICVAVRPLSVKELSIALTIESEDCSYEDLDIQPEKYSIMSIRNLCGLFVSVIDGRVYLIHQTAKEFLIGQDGSIDSASDIAWNNSISLNDSNLILANICMWYLRLAEFNIESPFLNAESNDETDCRVSELVKQYDFLEYSAMNWVTHFRFDAALQSHQSIEWALEVCDTTSLRFSTWFTIYMCRVEDEFEVFVPTTLTSLHVASFFGHDGVVRRLLATGIDVNATDVNLRTPLWLAMHRGHEDVALRLLAEPGINVNSEDMNGRTPLWLAIYGGHQKVFDKLLATSGIGFNVVGFDGNTPLGHAIDFEEMAMVSKLLNTPGIDVNAGGLQFAPLLLAVQWENEWLITQLLQQRGIEVNSTDRLGRTPLWLAINAGNDEIIRQLLAVPDIDVNAADVFGRTPLWRAVNWNIDEAESLHNDSKLDEKYERIVGQLLAVSGIDTNKADESGKTPLEQALALGRKGIARLLERSLSSSIPIT